MRGGVKALELMWGVEERPSTWPQLEKMEMENNLFGYVVSNTARLQRGDVDGGPERRRGGLLGEP